MPAVLRRIVLALLLLPALFMVNVASAAADPTLDVVEDCVTVGESGYLDSFNVTVTGTSNSFYIFAESAPGTPGGNVSHLMSYQSAASDGTYEVSQQYNTAPADLDTVYVNLRPFDYGQGPLVETSVPVCGLDYTDTDGDGVRDQRDNCPNDANPGQRDFDGDGQGDVCDSDDDGDGVADANDQCADSPVGAVVLTDGCLDPSVQLYYPSGPRTEVQRSALTGWSKCYSGAYGASGKSIAQIRQQCNGPYLLLAGGPAGGDKWTVLAAAPREDVLFETGSSNVTHAANGSEWYFSGSYSWGFANAGDAVHRNSCDIGEEANADLRLCWHTGGGALNGGFRAGNNLWLNDSSDWERAVYSSWALPGDGGPADGDGDGVPDATDNCPNDANPGQVDTDDDGPGDACDSEDNRDTDGDGVQNHTDNCVDVANAQQTNTDGDDEGDACDADDDGDGVLDDNDNCRTDANPGQADDDFDGRGNACDSVDGVPGGRLLARGTVRTTAGTDIVIKATNACGSPSHITVTLANGSTFKNTGPGTMRCVDRPEVSQEPATNSGFDAQSGSAPGQINGKFNGSIDWLYLDRGASSRDRIRFTIHTDGYPDIVVNQQTPRASSAGEGTVFTLPPEVVNT